MGIEGISRIEEYFPSTPETPFDRMLQRQYKKLDQDIFSFDNQPEEILFIDDIAAYNEEEGWLSADEISI